MIVGLVKETGSKAAVTTSQSWVSPGTNPYLLDRIRVTEGLDALTVVLSGFREGYISYCEWEDNSTNGLWWLVEFSSYAFKSTFDTSHVKPMLAEKRVSV